MPDKKKKYFGLLGLIGILIIGLLLFLLNSYSHDNSSSLEKINNDFQEENIKEVHYHLFLLDNTIVNLIVFLLIFLIAVYFVYFFRYSPVVRNNSRDTVKLNENGDDFQRSFFRKIAFLNLNVKSNFTREDYFFLYDDNKYNKKNNININNKNNVNLKGLTLVYKDDKFLFNDGFQIENYSGKIIKIKVNVESLALEIKQKNKKESVNEKEKEKFFSRFMDPLEKENRIIYKEKNFLDGGKEIQKLYFNNIGMAFQFFFEHFEGKGKMSLFHQSNIFAALLSYGFFFLSFFLLYFVLYFFYAFIYCLFFLNEKEIKEEEKNKFLIAFYKTLRAITFFNIRSFYKIIPVIGFLIVLIFDGVIFFSINTFLIPIFYNVINPEKKEITEIHKCNDDDLKEILKLKEGEKIKIQV